MIERGLQNVTVLQGVASVHLVEEDGFIAYTNDPDDAHAPHTVSKWLEMASSIQGAGLVTTVMERGYVVLKPIGRRVLMVSCERSVNLGALRKALEELNWT